MNELVLIHTHGIGAVDYSSMKPEDLDSIERRAAADNLNIIPGVFLARDYLAGFKDVLQRYAADPARFPHILGFSVEGPLLGKIGGVPPRGIWSPNADEWSFIARLGELGLKYIVIGPDGGELDDPLDGSVTFRDVIDLFYTSGVRIALGHYRRADPVLSARRTDLVIDYVQQRYGPGPEVILTDHLYNDMPRNFKHVWRTEAERAGRAGELAEFLSVPWSDDTLDHILGPVPASIVRATKSDRIMPFLNFDGDHVDLEVCRRTLDYLGPKNVIGITDDTELARLAGEDLAHHEGGLWYRSDGIVAAGTGHIDKQVANLERIGYGHAVRTLFRDNQLRALAPLLSASGARS